MLGTKHSPKLLTPFFNIYLVNPYKNDVRVDLSYLHLFLNYRLKILQYSSKMLPGHISEVVKRSS